MKKLSLIFIVMILVSGLFAADTDNFDIVVTCSYLDVSLMQSSDHGTSFDTWNLGVLAPGAGAEEMTGADHIWVSNGSNTSVDFSAYVDSPAPSSCGYGTATAWTPSPSAGTDQFHLELGIGTASETPTSYTTITSLSAPGETYLTDAGAGIDHELYARFTVPTATSDGCEHTLNVSVMVSVH
ncbi:MAG: hypothetical protein ACLFSQ_06045 [Candidatus Zixiibacteriota bacterium]